VTQGRRRRVDEIPEEQSVVAGANLRTLRQRKGWSQAKLGELMGWQNAFNICAAEGRRDGRQRRFTAEKIERLSSIFGISPRAAHEAMHELRRPPAVWVRLPGMRSRDRRSPRPRS
jgi:transcriptional regulator with XRE-family HTH domain